jgi:hypothetical protein
MNWIEYIYINVLNVYVYEGWYAKTWNIYPFCSHVQC